MKQLEGHIALVTGGSSGIGLASAKELAARGAHVFITGRRTDALEAAVASIGGRNVTAVPGDAGSLDDLERLLAQIQAEKGHLDILFANAAIVEAASFPDITQDTFDRHFDVNVKGVFFLVQKALPLLRDRGAIITRERRSHSRHFRVRFHPCKQRSRHVSFPQPAARTILSAGLLTLATGCSGEDVVLVGQPVSTAGAGGGEPVGAAGTAGHRPGRHRRGYAGPSR